MLRASSSSAACRLLGLCVALTPPLLGACGEQPRDPRAESVGASVVLSPELSAAFAKADVVPVIINFREPETRNKSRAGKSAAIAAAQEHVLALRSPRFQLTRRFQHVPALAARITRADAERLSSDPTVESIFVDAPGGGQLKEAMPAIGGDKVKSIYGLTGKGVRVAVLDSGAATTHPDLKSAIVAQQCFTQRACPPSRTTRSESAEDDHGHGTHVTGIITSDGTIAPPGFAPDAEIVAVKVNDQNDAGMESDWVAGLDWVYENLATLKVRVVNMSLGTTASHGTSAECDSRHPAMLRAVKNLVDAGVVVFAATGNSGLTNALPAPACVSGLITVGATYDTKGGHQPPMAATYNARWGGAFARCGDDTTEFDQITCFTNATAKLDLLAPGAPITSTAPRNRTDTYWGTSQASPAAAGVAALMLQCKPDLTPDQIKQAMVSTGVKVMDKRNNLTYPSLRALEAVRAACPELADEEPPAESDGGMGAPPATETDGGVTQPPAKGDGGTSGADARTPTGRDARAPEHDSESDDQADDDSTSEEDDVTQSEEPSTADDGNGDGDDEGDNEGSGQGGKSGGCALASERDDPGTLLAVLLSLIAVIARNRGARSQRSRTT